MIGSVVSGFLIEKILGEGGMGTVYLATRTQDGRRVALKFLPPDQARQSAWRRRFIRTAEMVAEIRHPSIARILSIHSDGDNPHFAMEYVPGEPLDERLKRKKRLAAPEGLRVVRDIARGLQTAHQARMMHRDIKPANILLTPGGKVKIIDFGLGKDLEGSDGLTFAGQILGTPCYMAPEQWGTHEVDHRCDIFSLGSTLYHLITGKLPFKARKPLEVAPKIASGDFLPPCQAFPGLSQEVELVIYRMMEVERRHRYQTMGEVADDLQRLLEGKYPNVPRLEEISSSERKRHPLMRSDTFRIGRKSTCDLVFNDRSVSREHAEIKRSGTGYLLKDLSSKGGSYVRDSRVGEVALKNNDTIRLGKRTFIFRDGRPDLANSSVDDFVPDRDEVQQVSVPILDAMKGESDRRTVLTLIEHLDPETHGARVLATQRLLDRILGQELASTVSNRLAADLKAARARIAARLFLITHEKLGEEPGSWLSWWDQRWAIYPPQVGPSLPPFMPAPRLRLLKGGDRRHVDLSVGLDWRLGRDKACDLQLAHGSVSRQHATVMRLHERIAIRDQSSRLGTLINGTRIQVAFLQPGDRIHLGRVKLVFETKHTSGSQPPTQAGAFPIDPGAFEILVELGHPSTALSLIGFIQASQNRKMLEAEVRLLYPREEELRGYVLEEAAKNYARRAKKARELLPTLLKADAGEDATKWKAVLKQKRRKLGPQVLPTGWALPI